MKQNKWKSNEANDKSLTGAKSSVERQNGNSNFAASQVGWSSVVNIYWLIKSPSLRHIIAYSWRQILI